MQVIKLRAHTGSNLISEQESQNGHESVFSMKMKCCLLAAAAKPQSSSLLQTQRKSRQLQNCRVLSGRQCPSDIQVYTFAARGIHPALFHKDIFHHTQNFRVSITTVLFLVLTGEVCPSVTPELWTNHLGPMHIIWRRAECSYHAEGQSMLVVLEGKETGNSKGITK